jgi:uncharacterized protein (TIGR03437 family)
MMRRRKPGRVNGARRSLWRGVAGGVLLVGLLMTDRVAFGPSHVAAQEMAATLVNAASFANESVDGVAPNSIGSVFGQFATMGSAIHRAPDNVFPLPTTLGGVSVTIGGRPAPLFFVSLFQINLAVPGELAEGAATIVVTNADNSTRTGTVRIVRSQMGLFTVNASGSGTAAALTTRDGLLFESVINPDRTPRPIEAGTVAQPNYLVLFGTGFRGLPAVDPNDANGVAEALEATIQGVPVPVLYAGAAPGFVGLDQLNLILPPELSGFGSVEVRVRTQTREANVVTITIGGQFNPFRLTPLLAGQVVEGILTADDQVQPGPGNRTYFFDAFLIETTQANTTLAIDLRSRDFDAAVLLFAVNDQELIQIAQDDQSGGYGAPESANNNNALLLTVLPTPGRYAVFATSSDFEPNGRGAYQLRYTTGVMQPISYGQAVNATITTSDYRNSAGVYLDVYWFMGQAGETARINLSSQSFDPYLILHTNEGDPPIGFDDNGGGGLNSQLTSPLPMSGIYIVLATPFEVDRTGSYALSLSRLTAGVGMGDADGSLFNQSEGDEGRSVGRSGLPRSRTQGWQLRGAAENSSRRLLLP